jgi:hypothetical protein
MCPRVIGPVKPEQEALNAPAKCKLAVAHVPDM